MKKEEYFTSDNIEMRSKELITSIYSQVRRRELKINKAALIVCDMQDYFLDAVSHAFVPSSKAIISNINLLINLFKSNDLHVIFTQHLNNDQNAQMLALWWKDTINELKPLYKINKDIEYNSEKIIRKTQYDAFFKTELNDFLSENNIDSVIICGVMTHLCCESTARAAFHFGYNVIIPIDGTATYNFKLFEASLLIMAHGFAHIDTTQNIQGAINK
ncbi:MAG: cysteine hydrolase [Candidatus Kapabacteria bacterium]|nr:cysteine hydrolase [Candidatus Kapabacteria bacterium]